MESLQVLLFKVQLTFLSEVLELDRLCLIPSSVVTLCAWESYFTF